jgi:RimJ/RimL family protein N-acetyltransferase
MRAAVLHLAFEGFGAERALSEAFEDNLASGGVSRALGYERDGTTWATRKGESAPMRRYLLTKDAWQQRRRDDITITGLDAVKEFLGLASSEF